MAPRHALAALSIVAALAVGVFVDAGDARSPRQPCKACPKRISTPPTFFVTGRGWGHGIGMSQYGALGFARRGSSYSRILAHYYRGTALAPAPVASVRVLLFRGARKATVSSKRPFRVRDANGDVHPLAAGAHAFGPGLRLKPVDAEEPKALAGPLLFLPGGAPLRTSRPYRGTLEVSVVEGRLRVVNVVRLDLYLYGVVADEMPETWPLEALKAQAVAARSYAIANRRRGAAFDLFADVRSQVYGGIEAESPSAKAAVDGTARKVVTYRGQPVSTPYHSTSGGRTAAVADVWPAAKPAPYLVSVRDPYDSLSPYHTWGPIVFPADVVARRLRTPRPLLDVITTRNGSGRASSIVARGSTGEATIQAADVRRVLGLRSTWFHVGVLSLAAPRTPVAYGSRARLTGTARGRAVVLERRTAASEWERARALRRAGDGSFSAYVRPRATTLYRLASGEARSQALRVRVAPLLRLFATSDLTGLRGRAVPSFPGASVELQRSRAGGWATVARATLDTSGRFRSDGLLEPGTYRARLEPGHGFAAVTTRPVTLP